MNTCSHTISLLGFCGTASITLKYIVSCHLNSALKYLKIYSITSVARAVGPSVTVSSTDFSFQNLIFWNLFGIFCVLN
jgi:hypothetical protein